MSRYRKVDPRIWNDEKFRDLSNNGKLVFFMLLTHPHMTAIGAMRATVPGMAAEMGWGEKAFREAFGEVLSKGMARHDEKACFLSLKHFLKYNEPESPNVVKAWVSALDLLPECHLKDQAIQEAKAFAEAKGEAFGKAFPEALPEGSPKAMPYQEQEQEQDKTPCAKKSPKSLPPGFVKFWDAWPKSNRKVDKALCVKRWKSHGCEEIADAIVADVEAKKGTKPWREGFDPAPSKYLNGRRWEDGPPDAGPAVRKLAL